MIRTTLVTLLLTSISSQALAQSIIESPPDEKVDQIVEYLTIDQKEKLDDADSMRRNARIIREMGEISDIASELITDGLPPSLKTKLGGTGLKVFGQSMTTFASYKEYAADKHEKMVLLEIGRFSAKLLDAGENDFSNEHLKALMNTSPEFNLPVTAVNVQIAKNMLVEAKADRAVFNEKLNSLESDIDVFRQDVELHFDNVNSNLDDLDTEIRNLGDDLDVALGVTNRIILSESERIIDNSKELAALQSKQIGQLEEKANEIRSDVAIAVQAGLNAEQAATKAYMQSQLNYEVLGSHTGYLQSIEVRTLRIDTGVTFLASQEFLKMPPEQRLDVINNPANGLHKTIFEPLGAEKAEALESAASAAKSQKLEQDIVSGIQTTMAIANSISTIGNELGWDFVQDEGFQDGVKYLNAAGGLAMAYFSGNPTAAINAVTSLFAGPNTAPSPGEAMILEKLELMDQKLDELLKGQEEIKELIEESTDRLEGLHYETLYKLDDLSDGFDDLKKAAASILVNINKYSEQKRYWNSCNKIASVEQRYQTMSLQNMEELVSDYPINFNECRLGVPALWPEDTEEYHALVKMMSAVKSSADEGVLPAVTEINGKVYEPLLKLLWSSFDVQTDELLTNPDDMALRLIASLSQPTEDIDNLRSKVFSDKTNLVIKSMKTQRGVNGQKSVQIQFVDLFNPGGSNSVGGGFEATIQTDGLIEGVDYFLTFAPYFAVHDPTQIDFKLYSLDELNSDERGIKRRLSNNAETLNIQFNAILNALNISIAQQTLLSGDLLIPKIADVVFSGSGSNLRNDLIIAMEENPTLAKNVLVYWTNKQLYMSRNLPERDFHGNILPAASEVTTSNENWVYNLVHYDDLYIKSSLVAPPSGDENCQADELGWRCIFGKNVNIEDKKISFDLTRITPDGEVEVYDKIELELPTPADVQNRKIRLRKEVYDLIRKRDELMSWAENAKAGVSIKNSNNIWAIDKSVLR